MVENWRIFHVVFLGKKCIISKNDFWMKNHSLPNCIINNEQLCITVYLHIHMCVQYSYFILTISNQSIGEQAGNLSFPEALYKFLLSLIMLVIAHFYAHKMYKVVSRFSIFKNKINFIRNNYFIT